MKVKENHFNVIKRHVEDFMKDQGLQYWVDLYEKGNFHRPDKVEDLQVRFNMDMFYAAYPVILIDNPEIFESGYTTKNLTAAMNKILPKVTRRY